LSAWPIRAAARRYSTAAVRRSRLPRGRHCPNASHRMACDARYARQIPGMDRLIAQLADARVRILAASRSGRFCSDRRVRVALAASWQPIQECPDGRSDHVRASCRQR
jgi:hypothetical protein